MPVLTEFNGCCGINIIESFPTRYTRGKAGQKEEDQDFLDELKRAEQDHKYEKAGLILIALNEKQRKFCHKKLLKQKYFVLIDRFYNQRHKSKITLYGKRTPRGVKRPGEEWNGHDWW